MENTVQAQGWEDLVVRAAPQAPAAVAPVASPRKVAAPKTAEQVQAAYLAHELRAPVTAIRLGLEILSEQVDSRLQADERQMLSLAVKNTARLEGLVNDIMDHAKLMSGKMSLEKEPVDVRAVVGDALDGLQATALAKGVKLNKEFDGPLPRVSGDARRIVQVLTNLISNAIKFTPARGSVTVSVKEGRFEHEGTLVFRVKDTGCGIKPQDLDKVFDMFIQTGSPVKKAEGTGLGLTLAKAMVGLHGGRIWAESWKEVGASFYFTIPVTPEDMTTPVEVYPKPVEYHGLIVAIARRMNAVLALFV